MSKNLLFSLIYYGAAEELGVKRARNLLFCGVGLVMTSSITRNQIYVP
jgi:hypothetical protein